MTVLFEPFLPLWALASIAILCAALALLSLWRNWRSGIFRTIALAALLGLLFNPLTREDERTALDDIVLLLTDKTASQRLDGRDAVAEDARQKIADAIERFDGVELRAAEFDGEEESRAIEALRTALADAPRTRLAGVIMVTDGQATDADAARSLGLDAPVHVMLTGDDAERDRKITLVNAPRYGIVGQPVRVSFRIDDFGPDETPVENQGSANVTLRVDGEEILRQRVPFGVEAGFDAPLNRPGRMVIELEVEERAGELTTRNNIVVLPISAIRDRLRVLLISGEPHPGERVWRNLLKSDPAVDLVHFTILRPIEKNDNTPVDQLALIQFPQDELFIEKLSEFNLLIFDRYTYRAVLSAFHFDNIARYVEQGGAVLIAAGPEYNGAQSLASRRNLSYILPALPAGGAIDQAFRPMIAERGMRHPVTADLPEEGFWGRWLRIMPVESRSGETLMADPAGAPLLILDRVGDGRVGLLLSDHVWLWARGFDGGGPHAELLRRIAHWLMKEPELEEEALSIAGEAGALVVRRRTIGDAPPPVTVTAPDGTSSEYELTQISPGLFETRIEDAPRGLYRAVSGELFAIGAVGLAAAPEFENVVSTGKKLSPLAEETGGGVFRVRQGAAAAPPAFRRIGANASAQSGADWAGLVERNAARIEAVREQPFAPPWAWLALIGAGLLAAWLIEGGRLSARRSGADAPTSGL